MFLFWGERIVFCLYKNNDHSWDSYTPLETNLKMLYGHPETFVMMYHVAGVF